SSSDSRSWPVFLICSGVYHNFHELGESKNLTFFKRAAEVSTEPLSLAHDFSLLHTAGLV
ncbi:MAG: hypothetical protein IJU93_04405, partial [Lachnospiraceae bacterium]|nr:hypothetical protein [Lachnospiraceae bacterium]